MLKMQENYWKQGTNLLTSKNIMTAHLLHIYSWIYIHSNISTYSFYIFFKCIYSFYAGVEKKGNQGEVYYWWIWRKVF